MQERVPRTEEHNNHALRVVLFGMPDAGKTTLLAALLRASDSQGNLLNGHVTDVSGKLLELQKRLKDQPAQPTTDQIISYPVQFQPLRTGSGADERTELVLFDCSGAAAVQLLSQHELFQGQRDEAALAHLVLQADTILLVVDGSENIIDLETDFGQFLRFLHLFERSRGRRIDVGGLPIFLVLTKCDRLAGTGSPAEWVESIEQRKEQVALRFKEFLAHERDEKGLPFGRVDLQVWATAGKRPGFPGTPADNEPFGVAELFREAFFAAESFRQTQKRATRRLARTVAQVLGVLILLSAFAALLVFGFWESAPSRLETRIERFRRQQSDSVFAAHRTPTAKIEELEALANDPAFPTLPQEKRSFVVDQLRELRAYQEYDQSLRKLTDPRDAVNNAQLTEIEQSLRSTPVPPEYQSEWSRTEAGRRAAEWLEDIVAIRDAVQRINSWYERLIAEGRLVLADINGPNLPARARKVLQAASMPPFPENEKDQLLPGSRRVTYETAFRFDSVAKTRQNWDEIKSKLEPYSKLSSS